MLKTALHLPDHTEIQDYLNKEDGWRKMLVTCEQTQLRKILHQTVNFVTMPLPLSGGGEGIYLCILPHFPKSGI